jgi:hypothetical protein
MNPLRNILILSILLYVTIYHTKYWIYFLSFVVPYIIITQFLMNDFKINKPKMKAFIAMWSHPGDPQIYATMKVNVTKTLEFLKKYSEEKGVKVGFTVLVMKVLAKMLKLYPQVNGNVIFGKFVENPEANVSCLVSTNDGKDTEFICVKDCDNLTLSQIKTRVQEKKKELEEGKNYTYNRKLLFCRILPTL